MPDKISSYMSSSPPPPSRPQNYPRHKYVKTKVVRNTVKAYDTLTTLA